MSEAATIRLTNLLEITATGEFLKEATVEGNIIQNVSLLGAVSLNGRVYTREAMQDAVKLYNGVQVFANHPGFQDLTGTGGRKFEDLAGKILNTRLVGDRVKGDVHLIEDEPIGEKLKKIAEQMPELVGFSHRARGEAERAEDGTVVIKRLLEVKALEIVVDPATTNGLFESVIETSEEEEEEMKDFTGVTIEQLKAARPDLIEGITNAVKADLTTEGEHTKELDESKARVIELEAENKELTTKVDAFEAADALRDRKDLVDAKLKDADLPEKAVTKQFRKDLEAAEDEAAIDAQIKDRKELVESLPSGSGGPRQPARDVGKIVEGEGEKKPVTDEVVGKAMSGMFR